MIKAEVPAQRSRRNFVEGTVLHGGLGLLQTILLDTTPEDNTERLVALMQRSIKSSYIPLAGFEGVLGEYASDEMRRRAYVLRDAGRLEEHGGRGVLERLWDGCWDHDPSDDLL